MTSRSSTQFMRRRGLVPHPPKAIARLQLSQHKITELSDGCREPEALRPLEGRDGVDRFKSVTWPDGHCPES